MLKQLLHIIFSLLFTFSVYRGMSQCENIDFSNGDFTNWTGVATDYWGAPYGSGTPPFTGFEDRHQIFNDVVPVTDPMACDNITRTAPGKEWTAQLGNSNVWGMIDELEYTISVSPESNLLLYHFAAILEEPEYCNPGQFPPHSEQERPKFRVEVRETVSGNLVQGSCGEYEEWANPNSINLRNCTENGLCTYYRAWTTIGIDLREYESLPAPLNQVTLKFRTEDCMLLGHFGYAYVSAECKKLAVEVQYCQNNNEAYLTAPDGFYYLWENGATTQSIVWPEPIIGDTVAVSLITVQGCTSLVKSVLEPSVLDGGFLASSLDVCEGDPVVFTDTSTAYYFTTNEAIPVVEWEWEFGSGDTALSPEAMYTFEEAGTYPVTLTVTAENGCKETIIKNVIVRPKPETSIVVEDKCMGYPVEFLDSTLLPNGYVTYWDWSFDDPNSGNNTSTSSEPEHTYLNAGTYFPQLIVTTNYGCKDTAIFNLTIFDAPVANFEHENNCAGENVIFNDLSTTSAGTNLASWLWNFDDGTPLFYGQDAYHQYDGAGTYNVSLLITNTDGCIDDITIPVDVLALELNFLADSVCLTNATPFENIANEPTVLWEWDFGDGNTSVEENPSHTYGYPGVHEVTFYAETEEGCSDEVKKFVYVKNNPSTAFNSDKYRGCAPLCINFLDYSYADLGIGQWEWDLAESSSNAENPSYCYDKPGIYDIFLKSTSVEGCVDSARWDSMIHVFPNPTANFSYFPEQLYSNNPEVEFTNLSLGASAYKWYFDNLGSSILKDTTFFFPYDVAAEYDVTLIASNDSGCKDTTIQKVVVEGIFQFDIPNTFTPNGDDLNDWFYPVITGADFDHYVFDIFDRWGDKIFSSEIVEEGWNGEYKEKMVKQDVYVWRIQVRERYTQINHVYYGHVLVIFPNNLR